MPGRRYTPEDRARVLVALGPDKEQWNVNAASRDTGVPEQTVRDWAKEWKRNGIPSEIEVSAADQAEDFLPALYSLRGDLFRKLQELIPKTEVKDLRSLATMFGITLDKIKQLEGLAAVNDRPEPEIALNPAQIGQIAGQAALAALKAAHERDAEISDTEVVEQAEWTPVVPEALPPVVSDQGDI